MDRQRKEFIIISATIIILFVLGFYFAPEISGNATKQQKQGKTIQVQLTKENFNLFLQQQKVVQDMPKDALISLRLYNTDTGTRQWEKAYIIRKGSVKEGYEPNPDIEIIVASKYIWEFARDMCNAVKIAKQNNEISFNPYISTTSLLWKYRGMLGYRSCFGL